jgi:hypothetical protein
MNVGPCHHGMARPQVADGGTASYMDIKDEKGDLVADSHSITVRWRNYFSQILNVHGVSDVGQAEIHTA